MPCIVDTCNKAGTYSAGNEGRVCREHFLNPPFDKDRERTETWLFHRKDDREGNSLDCFLDDLNRE